MSVVEASVAAQLLCLDRDLESRHCEENRRGGRRAPIIVLQVSQFESAPNRTGLQLREFS